MACALWALRKCVRLRAMSEALVHDWLARGAQHIWRPYTQMKTALPALPVVSAEGIRLKLGVLPHVMLGGLAHEQALSRRIRSLRV